MLRIQLLQRKATWFLCRLNATLPAGEPATVATRRKESSKSYVEPRLMTALPAGERATRRREHRYVEPRLNTTQPAGKRASWRRKPEKSYMESRLDTSLPAGERSTWHREPREKFDSEDEEGQRNSNARWVKSPWKIKQLRHSRHVLNLIRKGKVSEAEEVLQQMKKARLRPDVVVYNSILTGYSRQGDFKQAFKIFNELKKRGLLPTDRTYSSMFAACGAAGPPAAATLDKLREEMERRDVQPNTITINALISALALCGRQGQATQAYLDMEKMHLEPDVFTFGGLLMTMSKDHIRGMTMAQGVWSEMKKVELEPDLHCYNMLLQVLRDGGLEDSLEGEGAPLVHSSRQLPIVRLIPRVSTDALKKLVDGFNKSKKKRHMSEREGNFTREMTTRDREGMVEEEDLEEREGNFTREMTTRDREGMVEEEDLEERGGSFTREMTTRDREGMVEEEDLEEREGSFTREMTTRNGEGMVEEEDLEEREGSVVKNSEDGHERSVAREANEKLKKGSVCTSEREDKLSQGIVLEKERKREVLNWDRGEGAERSKVYVRKEVEFELSEQHNLVLSVGSERAKEKQPPHLRWLEKKSVEALFAAMKQNRLHPDIHTFHLLAHLTLDPAHLLVTMEERKVAPDVKLMVAAVKQQAKQLHNLQGAWVLVEYCRGIGLDLGQAGYQALASGCVREQDSMTLFNRMQADRVRPNQHVMGTLIGQAVRDHSYEYLTSLLRVMMHIDLKPNATILSMLESAAAHNAKTPRQRNRLNGFKGFHSIWKKKVCPREDSSQEEHELQDDFYVP